MKRFKYTKESEAYRRAAYYFKHTTQPMRVVSEQTGIPYHGVRKLRQIYDEGRKK